MFNCVFGLSSVVHRGKKRTIVGRNLLCVGAAFENGGQADI